MIIYIEIRESIIKVGYFLIVENICCGLFCYKYRCCYKYICFLYFGFNYIVREFGEISNVFGEFLGSI